MEFTEISGGGGGARPGQSAQQMVYFTGGTWTKPPGYPRHEVKVFGDASAESVPTVLRRLATAARYVVTGRWDQ